MDLAQWAAKYGRGALSHLQCEARVANKTVIKAVRHGAPVTHEVAEKLSRATNGDVAVDDIRRGFAADKPKAARRRRTQ